MKTAWRLFAVSGAATTLGVILLGLVGAREYGARLDWFFEPVRAAGIQLGWVLVVLAVLAVAAYSASLIADAISCRKV